MSEACCVLSLPTLYSRWQGGVLPIDSMASEVQVGVWKINEKTTENIMGIMFEINCLRGRLLPMDEWEF